MARKRFTAEQIISKLREAEVLLAQGAKMGVVCKRIAVTDGELPPFTPTEAMSVKWRKFPWIETQESLRFTESFVLSTVAP